MFIYCYLGIYAKLSNFGGCENFHLLTEKKNVTFCCFISFALNFPYYALLYKRRLTANKLIGISLIAAEVICSLSRLFLYHILMSSVIYY